MYLVTEKEGEEIKEKSGYKKYILKTESPQFDPIRNPRFAQKIYNKMIKRCELAFASLDCRF